MMTSFRTIGLHKNLHNGCTNCTSGFCNALIIMHKTVLHTVSAQSLHKLHKGILQVIDFVAQRLLHTVPPYPYREAPLCRAFPFNLETIIGLLVGMVSP